MKIVRINADEALWRNSMLPEGTVERWFVADGETALAGRWKSNSLAAGGADPGRRGHLPSMRTPKMSQFRGPVFERWRNSGFT